MLVGVLLLISERNRNNPDGGTSTGTSNGARPCTVTVTADLLNVRSSPDGDAPVVDTFDRDAVVSADRVTRNGYRQLGPDRWAAEEFLDPTADSDCG
ncbi:MAG: hypothetical protein DLM62_18000 [Pseudonocardiales bacterium]|nr:MAG: hypothetical protein DLM62_18000 [Pseudonocardiales bacterium]